MSQIEILQERFLMRHESCSIDNHINSLRICYQRLNENGLLLPETISVTSLMILIPPELGHVISSFVHVKEDELKFETVASAIEDDYQ